jgi:hypothetical protein
MEQNRFFLIFDEPQPTLLRNGRATAVGSQRESTTQWLRAHPGIEIVRRDRASLYAEAAAKAAPHAVRVADRWLLLHNSETLLGALVLHHRLLAEVEQAAVGRTKTHLRLSRNNHPLPNRFPVNGVCTNRTESAALTCSLFFRYSADVRMKSTSPSRGASWPNMRV